MITTEKCYDSETKLPLRGIIMSQITYSEARLLVQALVHL
jgi:hypothetical protein